MADTHSMANQVPPLDTSSSMFHNIMDNHDLGNFMKKTGHAFDYDFSAAQESISLKDVQNTQKLLVHTTTFEIKAKLKLEHQGLVNNNTLEGFEFVEQEGEFSIQMTAETIISSSIKNFSLFNQQNSNLPIKQRINDFVQKTEAGINKGFFEARNILSSLGAMTQEHNANLKSTQELIQEGLLEFKRDALAELSQSN